MASLANRFSPSIGQPRKSSSKSKSRVFCHRALLYAQSPLKTMFSHAWTTQIKIHIIKLCIQIKIPYTFSRRFFCSHFEHEYTSSGCWIGRRMLTLIHFFSLSPTMFNKNMLYNSGNNSGKLTTVGGEWCRCRCDNGLAERVAIPFCKN